MTDETIGEELAKKLTEAEASIPKLEAEILKLARQPRATTLEDILAQNAKDNAAIQALAGAKNDVRKLAVDVDSETAGSLCSRAVSHISNLAYKEKLPAKTAVVGVLPVTALSPTPAEQAMVKRHDIHVVHFSLEWPEGQPPMWDAWYFPKRGARKQREPGAPRGGGGKSATFTDGGQAFTSEEYARAFADAGSVEKVAAAIADPNKSASFSHLADSVMGRRIAAGHTVTKS